jgi:Holliday junction resolvasome RuvABC endonuclease subunit
MNQTKQVRILAISLSSRGFGYAVMEGERALVIYGNKSVKKDKNVNSLVQIDKMVTRYQPDVLVLHDVNAKGTYRALRIKALHRRVIKLAKKRKLKVKEISVTWLRSQLLGDPKGTKHEMAEMLAKEFPNELASRLPPKRKAWVSEDGRMDTFDAVALAVAFSMKRKSFGFSSVMPRPANAGSSFTR